VLTEATERSVRITPEGLKAKKKEIIQAECQACSSSSSRGTRSTT
jgi:hypothetical protein